MRTLRLARITYQFSLPLFICLSLILTGCGFHSDIQNGKSEREESPAKKFNVTQEGSALFALQPDEGIKENDELSQEVSDENELTPFLLYRGEIPPPGSQAPTTENSDIKVYLERVNEPTDRLKVIVTGHMHRGVGYDIWIEVKQNNEIIFPYSKIHGTIPNGGALFEIQLTRKIMILSSKWKRWLSRNDADYRSLQEKNRDYLIKFMQLPREERKNREKERRKLSDEISNITVAPVITKFNIGYKK